MQISLIERVQGKKIYLICLRIIFSTIKRTKINRLFQYRDLTIINFDKNIQSHLILLKFIHLYKKSKNSRQNNIVFVHLKISQSLSILFVKMLKLKLGNLQCHQLNLKN